MSVASPIFINEFVAHVSYFRGNHHTLGLSFVFNASVILALISFVPFRLCEIMLESFIVARKQCGIKSNATTCRGGSAWGGDTDRL